MAKKTGLGRGLSHLAEQNIESMDIDRERVVNIDLSEIKPNPYQPRKHFDEKSLDELAESIKLQGVFQPILLSKALIGYELIAGERRVRASKIAGLEVIPSIIVDYTTEQLMEIAVIENLQREDLSVVDEAYSYEALINNLGYTQEVLANRIGKSRSYVTNILRILKLEQYILDYVQEGKLSMGQVKPLISLTDDKKIKKIINIILKENLSSRQVEELAKSDSIKEKVHSKSSITPPRNRRIEAMIREKINAKVKVTGDSKGKIEINYSSNDELEVILEGLNLV
jgi:ParB family chromosome partitioning protein